MPKAPKAAKARHDPLHVELEQDNELRKFGRISKPGKRQTAHSDDEDNGDMVEDAKTSKRILALAREQQEEVAREMGEDDDEEWDEEDAAAASSSRPRGVQPLSDDDDDEDLEEGNVSGGDGEAELEIDPEDHATLDALVPVGGEAAGGRTLADLIFSRMEGGAVSKGMDDEDEGPPDPRKGLPDKVVEVYTKIGYLLSRYKSGEVPKALKILPSMPNWAQLLALTSPTDWTPHATRKVGKMLVSNLKPSEARVYLQGVLLDKCRDDMRKNGGKLNVHLYQALKDSCYKPAAFFKGIIFPLCESACTLKEAAILCGVLRDTKIPLLHSAAALLRLSNMDYSGPVSLFIRTLLNKKYALPFRVVDALVFHFIRLANSPRSRTGEDKLPVMWQQSLLVFVQRYGSDINQEQKDALLDVIRVRPHPTISPEIRREIIHSVERGAPRPGDGDVVMA